MNGRLRVLVVDDQPIILEAVRQMLAGQDELEIELHSDPTTAIDLALRFNPAVILCDINMDPIGGFDVLAKIRADAQLTDVPVVMLSVAEEPETKVEAFRCGANDYVVKLPSALELVARVRYHANACLAAREREAAFRALLESRAALEQRNVEIEQQKAKLEVMNRDLAESSITDPLTGLRNRRYLRVYLDTPPAARLRATAEEERRHEGPRRGAKTLYLLDLDHFKQINDKYGHDAGDAVLVEVARRLRTKLRTDDGILRWGGEEFLLIAQGHSPEQDVVMAKRIIDAIGSVPMRVGVHTLRITCSMGFAPCPWVVDGEDGSRATLDQTLSLADLGAYLGKLEGRNRAFGVYPAAEDVAKMLGEIGAEPARLRGADGRIVKLRGVLGPGTAPGAASLKK